MSRIFGTNVIAPVTPGSIFDTFPTHIDTYGQGGYRSVSGISERDAIPSDRKSPGMMVHTIEDGKFWILGTGEEILGYAPWVELPFSQSEILLENVVYTTGDQIISGRKTFAEQTQFYDRVRAKSGLYFDARIVGNFSFFEPKGLDTGCTQLWCQQPEDEALDEPGMPFDPRRYLTGAKGYTTDGRNTIRIGNGIVSGAKTEIFTIWVGKTGIGESGYGWEVPLISRPSIKTLIRPSTYNYPRPRGVEFYFPILSGTFDDLPDGFIEGNILEERIVNLNSTSSEGTASAEPGNINNGGDGGGAGGGIGLNLGVGVLMLFGNTAPLLRRKDQYLRRYRAFNVVEKGSTWTGGFELGWTPFKSHLFTGEKYIQTENPVLYGTGLGIDGGVDYITVDKSLDRYRTSGLYNIKDKITWSLYFTGKIAGYRGDYNIEPWTGRCDTEVYPISKRYWGVSENTTLTADEITGSLNWEYAFDPRQVGSSAKKITPNGKYIYFAWPADTGFNNIDFFLDYSNSKFIQTVPDGYRFFIDDQEAEFEQTLVPGVKNKYNYEEDYYLFRNRWILNRTDPLKVSVKKLYE